MNGPGPSPQSMGDERFHMGGPGHPFGGEPMENGEGGGAGTPGQPPPIVDQMKSSPASNGQPGSVGRPPTGPGGGRPPSTGGPGSVGAAGGGGAPSLARPASTSGPGGGSGPNSVPPPASGAPGGGGGEGGNPQAAPKSAESMDFQPNEENEIAKIKASMMEETKRFETKSEDGDFFNN